MNGFVGTSKGISEIYLYQSEDIKISNDSPDLQFLFLAVYDIWNIQEKLFIQ